MPTCSFGCAMGTNCPHKIGFRRLRGSLTPVFPVFLVVLIGCATGGPEPSPEPGTTMYHEASKEAYESALSAFERRDYSIAIERFERVRNRYPQSPHAVLAELRVADALFAQDRFLEAADAYRTFVSLRPAHPEADFAAFREGLSLMRQAPSDLWIMPPAHEKDLTNVRKVTTVLRRFLEDYPESEYSTEAQELLEQALGRLASHELYVADFYRKRGQWQAVVFRLETVLGTYSGLGFDAEAKVGLAEAYLSLDEPLLGKAMELLDEVLAEEEADPATTERARKLRESWERRKDKGRDR